MRTREFYERHGGKTIVLARFIPIIRTFAPVVAGVGRMEYRRFLAYNVLGGIGWVTSMTWAGYLLGQAIPDIGRYIHVVIVVVVILSLHPDRHRVVEGAVAPRRRRGPGSIAAVFRLIPREERFFDLFEEQAKNIVAAAGRLRELIFDFSDAPAKSMAIRELEHAGDVLTHDLIRKINTTFVTPFDREDVYALASRLDDVLDLIEAAADRLVLYRIKEPTSGARAFAEVIVKTADSVQAAVDCLRTSSKAYHQHCVEVNRLENEADRLLKELIAALFADVTDPIEVIKWKEIYETLEEVTDRCEDVVNVIEGIMLKMG